MTPSHSWQLDLAGRIMHCHQIEPHYACIALNVSAQEAAALVDCGVISKGFDDHDRERLDRFLNFLIRVEWKLKISAEIRRALELPLASLDDKSPAQIFSGSDEEMRRLRDAVDTMSVPKTKWWRVGH